MERQFVSFPKSGRSWIRYALASLSVADQVVFHHDGFEYNDGTRPPLDFHYNNRSENHDLSKRIIYLRRDPRDIMVSLFHQITGRFDEFYGFRGTISEFIRDPYFGAGNLQRFRRHWDSHCEDGHALAISYEDCHADFAGTLAAVLSYYRFEVSGERLAAVTELAHFENMKAIEEGGNFAEAWLQLRNGSPKVRRGRVGGYVDELSPADIDYLDPIFFRDGAAADNASSRTSWCPPGEAQRVS
jgi:hypothetical protein